MRKLLYCYFALALTVASLSGCASLNPFSNRSSSKFRPGATAPFALTRDLAAIRSRQIARINYVLWFGLDEVHDDFQGRAVIHFELRENARAYSNKIFIDFFDGTVSNLVINGKAVETDEVHDRYDGRQIRFSTSEFNPGLNRIEIAFSRKFSTSGNGFYRFKDPEDGKIYVYTNLEPFAANQVFPCFDQPDLKASFEVTVEAPEEWSVIANTLERDVSKVDGRHSWAFSPTPLMSTYVFALAGGPFKEWKSDAEGIPLRLFARQALAKWVDHDEWFKITREGLKFYSDYFSYPYPYSKYDQIIVPDFNAGAMENIGAVTFGERYVYQTQVRKEIKKGRADTILHEMAHMWFGNLVTMRWWNGLWLNESFATFMAARALEEASPYRESWLTFFSGSKESAYWEDNLVTTHPIETSVADTDQAFSNFDGITYGKGASVLKQLVHYLGEDDFREGLVRYFRKFALRNTALIDFMNTLGQASSKDLTTWQKSWLQTTGATRIETELKCSKHDGSSKEKIDRIAFRQVGAPKDIRPRKFKVALFKGPHPGMIPSNVEELTMVGEESAIVALEGKPCPDLVFPNWQDQDYAQIGFDSRSLETLKSHLSDIADPLARLMAANSLYDEVVNGRGSALRYLEVAETALKHERHPVILKEWIDSLVSPRSEDLTVARILPDDKRAELLERLEKVSAGWLTHFSPGSDLQLLAFETFLLVAHSDPSVNRLSKALVSKTFAPGIVMDQTRRWKVIQTLCRLGHVSCSERVTKELSKDLSTTGRREALIANVVMPDAQTKRTWYSAFLGSPHPLFKDLSESERRSAMHAFMPLGQEALVKEFSPLYVNDTEALSQTKDSEYSVDFAEALYPALCDSTPFVMPTAVVGSIQRSLKVKAQINERCLKARERLTKSDSP